MNEPTPAVVVEQSEREKALNELMSFMRASTSLYQRSASKDHSVVGQRMTAFLSSRFNEIKAEVMKP
jgi:hypothetical protein